MSQTDKPQDRRMPIIQVEKGGTTLRGHDGGPVIFYQVDVWAAIVENFKAGMYDPPK